MGDGFFFCCLVCFFCTGHMGPTRTTGRLWSCSRRWATGCRAGGKSAEWARPKVPHDRSVRDGAGAGSRARAGFGKRSRSFRGRRFCLRGASRSRGRRPAPPRGLRARLETGGGPRNFPGAANRDGQQGLARDPLSGNRGRADQGESRAVRAARRVGGTVRACRLGPAPCRGTVAVGHRRGSPCSSRSEISVRGTFVAHGRGGRGRVACRHARSPHGPCAKGGDWGVRANDWGPRASQATGTAGNISANGFIRMMLRLNYLGGRGAPICKRSVGPTGCPADRRDAWGDGEFTTGGAVPYGRSGRADGTWGHRGRGPPRSQPDHRWSTDARDSNMSRRGGSRGERGS